MHGTAVVIKSMAVDSAEARKRFFDEAERWHALSHKHIVQLYGVCHVSSPALFVCADATFGNFAQFFRTEANRSIM